MHHMTTTLVPALPDDLQLSPALPNDQQLSPEMEERIRAAMEAVASNSLIFELGVIRLLIMEIVMEIPELADRITAVCRLVPITLKLAEAYRAQGGAHSVNDVLYAISRDLDTRPRALR
jgi:hypothetical protein